MKEFVTDPLRWNLFGVNDNEFIKSEMAFQKGSEASSDGAVADNADSSRNMMVNFRRRRTLLHICKIINYPKV